MDDKELEKCAKEIVKNIAACSRIEVPEEDQEWMIEDTIKILKKHIKK